MVCWCKAGDWSHDASHSRTQTSLASLRVPCLMCIRGDMMINHLIDTWPWETRKSIDYFSLRSQKKWGARAIFGVETNHHRHPGSLIESSGGKGIRHSLLTARCPLPQPVNDSRDWHCTDISQILLHHQAHPTRSTSLWIPCTKSSPVTLRFHRLWWTWRASSQLCQWKPRQKGIQYLCHVLGH